MKNYGILKFKNADVDNFTSSTGLKIRRMLNPLLRKILALATKGKIIVDHYPTLEKGRNYIFVSTHNFVEDAIANLSTLDRNAYLLFGTSDQLEINPEMYAAWANGFIYVNRLDEKSRKDALLKMQKVLEAGSSVLIYAEGGFNNTENLLVQRLFASPFILSKACHVEVVPIAPFQIFGGDRIFMNIGEPIPLFAYGEKPEALTVLRDSMATLLYENLENHAPRIKRCELGTDPRLDYMAERRNEYFNTNWTKDVFDEEITRYYDPYERECLEIMGDLDRVRITKENARIMLPIKERIREYKRYDLKNTCMRTGRDKGPWMMCA